MRLYVPILQPLVSKVKKNSRNFGIFFVAILGLSVYNQVEVIKMTTGERIKARRKELGITADKLADIIGVSRSTVFRYENGFIEKMPLNNLVPIARALSTTVGYLMGWENDPASAEGDGIDVEVMSLFDGLSEQRKAEALNYLRFLSATEEKK